MSATKADNTADVVTLFINVNGSRHDATSQIGSLFPNRSVLQLPGGRIKPPGGD
jgi:hypothetical protein